MENSLHQNARYLSLKGWHELLVHRIDDSTLTLGGHPLPGFPDKEVQTRLNGAPANRTMQPAFRLFQIARQAFQASPLMRGDAQFLDFGAGWGRIWRYFIYDFEIENMHAFDVSPSLAKFWKSDIPGGTLDIGKPFHPLPYENNAIDFVVSNSVFSHLSEKLNLYSANELRRVMRRGGVFVGTTFGLSHLRRWANWQTVHPDKLEKRQQMLANLTDDFDRVIARYLSGEFIYLETNQPHRKSKNPLQEYEIAAVPEHWLRNNWSDLFEIKFFSQSVYSQALFVAIAL